MKEKRLLVEYHDIKFSLNEDTQTGELNIEGEFGKADVPTANGRIYPRHVWEREIEKIKKDMAEGKVFGHLNHPKDGKTDLKEVALVMKDLWLEPDGRVMGKATVVENQHGDQYRAIRKAGGKVGVSSRGMGSTKMGEGKYQGSEVVDDDYEYMTHDLVADPAVRTSYPEPVNENINEANEPKGEVVKTYTETEHKSIVESKDKEIETLKAQLEDAQKQLKEDEVPAQVDAAATEKAAEIVTQKINDMQPSDVGAAVSSEVPATDVPVDTTVDTVVVDEPSLDLEEAKKKLTAKDEEISTLKSQLEAKTKEYDTLVIESKKITESAKRFGIALAYEKEINTCKLQEDRKRLKELVGKAADFNSVESLIESVMKAKKTLSEEKSAKVAEQKKIDEATAKLQARIKTLEEDNDKKTRTIEEGLVKQNELSAKKYLEEKIQHNPNAQKIRTICEGISDKKKIDEVISQFSVATAQFESYDLIQRRVKLMEDSAKAKPKLVEEQIAKTKPSVQESKTGLDAEIADVGADF